MYNILHSYGKSLAVSLQSQLRKNNSNITKMKKKSVNLIFMVKEEKLFLKQIFIILLLLLSSSSSSSSITEILVTQIQVASKKK